MLVFISDYAQGRYCLMGFPFFRPRRNSFYTQEKEQEFEHREIKRSRLQKKLDSIVRTHDEPVLPKLCKILFISMFIITGTTLLVEISALRYHLGLVHFLTNLTTTGLGAWGIYAVLLALTCAIGIWSNKANFRKKQRESGTTDRTDDDRERSARAIKRLNAAYWRYIKVCFIGFVFWLMFYLIVPRVF